MFGKSDKRAGIYTEEADGTYIAEQTCERILK
jgi:hypothetical protein